MEEDQTVEQPRAERAGLGELAFTLDTQDPVGEVQSLNAVLSRMFGRSADRPRVGRYLIDRRLGAGAMGVVYEAFDPELHRAVAIKLLPQSPARRRENEARLLREARSLAKIKHPNVVPVHDVGSWERGIYIAMEFVDGGDLSDWLAKEDRSPKDIIRHFVQAGRGLQAAHDAGIVHRDFKPANTLVSASGRVQVTDFGLASGVATEAGSRGLHDRAVDAVDPRLTATGAVVGTPAYMAPEQLDGKKTDARADQFAFCVALWEALHGQRPFRGDTLLELRVAIDNGPPPAPDSTSRKVDRALRRGLSFDPAARYPSMSALLRDLDPAPRRSRWLTLGVSSVAVVVAVAVRPVEAVDPACNAPEAELAELWGEVRPDLPRSADAQEVAARLEALGDEWVSARRRICEEQPYPGRRTTLQSSAVACLEVARGRIRTIASMLEEGDSARKHATARLVRGTTSPSNCLNPELLARMPIPNAALGQDDALALLVEIAEADTLASGSMLEEARVRFDALLEREDATRFPAIMSAAAGAAARVHLRLGDLASARALGERAYEQAVLAGNEVRAFHALVGLAYLHGIVDGDLELARWHVRVAQLLEQRVTEELRPADRSALQEQIGQLDLREGDVVSAVARLEDALGLLVEEEEPEPSTYAGLAATLAGALIRLGQTEEAASVVEEAVARVDDSEGPPGPEVANLWIIRGRISASRDPDGAELPTARHFEHAIEILEHALGPTSPALIVPLNDLALVHRRRGRLKSARELLYRARRLVPEGGGNPSQAVTLESNLADVELDLGDVIAARGHAARAIELAEDPKVHVRPRAEARAVWERVQGWRAD